MKNATYAFAPKSVAPSAPLPWPALTQLSARLVFDRTSLRGEDAQGRMGATACVVVNRFIPYYQRTGDWEAMAWWVHDHLPYSDMEFFPKYAAFNLQWREEPIRGIYSFIPPRRGRLTEPGKPNWAGKHEQAYTAMLAGIG